MYYQWRKNKVISIKVDNFWSDSIFIFRIFRNKCTPTFIIFWNFFQGLLSYYRLKRLKFYYISLHIFRGYVYSFCQIFQRLCVFKGLRLFRTLEYYIAEEHWVYLNQPSGIAIAASDQAISRSINAPSDLQNLTDFLWLWQRYERIHFRTMCRQYYRL